jgi:hypothetical protein
MEGLYIDGDPWSPAKRGTRINGCLFFSLEIRSINFRLFDPPYLARKASNSYNLSSVKYVDGRRSHMDIITYACRIMYGRRDADKLNGVFILKTGEIHCG